MQIKNITLLFCFFSFSFSYDLNNLLNTALKSNYKIKSYIHNINSKNYDIKKAKSKYLPSLNLYSYATYEHYKEKYPNGYETTLHDKTITYGINIKQILFDKSIFPNIKNSEYQKDVTKLEKKIFISNLEENILSNYFQILTSKENLYYKKLKKENYLKILQEIQAKYKYSFATKTDVIQAKSNYVSAINEYLKAKVSYENYITNLKLLLLTIKPIKIEGKINNNIATIIKNSIFLKDKNKISNNPSLKESQLYIKIAKNTINANRANYYPNISVNSDFYQTNSENSISDKDHFKISLNLNWNLYAGGETKNNVESTKELYLAAINDFNYQKITLELNFNENWTNLQNNLELLKSDKEKINKAKEYLLRAQESLKYKTISLTDYYLAQNDYYQALINYNNDKLITISYYLKILQDINEIEKKINILNSFIN